MHRFRKKSDAKRAQVPEHLIARSHSRSPQPAASQNPPDPLPGLPPVTDFRTSLILPSLSRRFTLLRSQSGDPISLDDVRTKIVAQRLRGAEHQIFEEEEDMIVDALAQLRTHESSPFPATPNNTAVTPSSPGTFAAQQDSSINLSTRDSDYPSSISGGTSPSLSPPYSRSTPSSPSALLTSGSPRYSSKRMSNNMFSSGRLHDANYLRSVSKASAQASRSAASIGGDSHGGSARSARLTRGADASPRVAMPDLDAGGDSSASSEKASAQQTSPLTSHSPASAVPLRIAKEFTVQQVKRTSLALEEVIRGLEEEAEETIVVPRTSVSRAGTVNSTQSPKASETPSAIGTPIPWMTEEARVDDRDRDDEPAPLSTSQPQSAPMASPPSSPGPHHRPGTTSPTPRLPGYIPGMTRPLTPRDADSDRDDGATGYSTTPRARSPALPQFSHSFSSRHHRNPSLSSDGQSILPPSILRSSRNSGQQIPLRTSSPGYNARSRGNSTGSAQIPSPVPSPAPDERFKSDVLLRRPLSPLVGTQTTAYGGGSRPGTPSSPGPWGPSSPLAQAHTISSRENNDSSRPGTPGNGRNGGLVSPKLTAEEVSSGAMSVAGPALPDSPLMGGRNGGVIPIYGWEQAQNRNGDANNGSGNEEFGQPRQSAVAAKIAARAPTPVHTHSRTPSASESGHEPMLLNRTVNRRVQKRVQSATPPPQIQTQSPPALHTPSSSSNSSNLNVNASMYSGASPLFSPMLNTSASSLVSVGSSYHSWADENMKKNRWDQLVEFDSQRSAWQDILNNSGNGSTRPEETSETVVNPDQELHSLTGLTKGDLVVVQGKLVADAQARRGVEPPRSPTRRRRMSNSRASFSAAQSGRESGTNSPAPPARQPTPVIENGTASPLPRYSPENTSRANALLDSVLNSIQSQAVPSTSSSSDAPTAEPFSSTDDDSGSKFPSISSIGMDSLEEDPSALRLKALADAISISEQPLQLPSDNAPLSSTPPAPEPSQSPEEDSGEATEVPASQSWRNPQPLSYRDPSDTARLVQDVSRKAAAATAALKSPSLSYVGELDASLRRKNTRRIDPQKIGSPHFVSSSTSVDAVPISPVPGASLSSTPSLKLSQRFKKLRGTLRTKPSTPNGDEVSPFMLSTPTNSMQSPYSASSAPRQLPSPAGPTQTIQYVPSQLSTAPRSATDQGNSKVPVSPPPASAAPGLKNFIMARFRKPKKEAEAPARLSSESTSPVSPPHDRDSSRYRLVYSPTGPARSLSTSRSRRPQDNVPLDAERTRSPTPDPATVDQLFNAAIQLGVDQDELNELLARSTSSASSRKMTWDQPSTTSLAAARSVRSVNRGPASSIREGRSFDRPRTPDQVVYKPTARPTLVNRPSEGEVVRRTIILASDNPSVSELDALIRKNSLPGRPQRSDSSVSLHSVASGSREPPVPKLPSNMTSSKAVNPTESGTFHDVYSQDASVPSAQNGSPGNLSPITSEEIPSNPQPGEQTQGPAVELLHLSNGQVIWSVLDSLRAEDDDDSESLFRRSMASSRGNDEDLEVRFKEHRRWSSKGSNFSYVSHSSRRRQAPVGGPRPETKLYKANSMTIGHLIENISKDLDSGSFNFTRPAAMTTTPSNPTSFHSDASGSTHQVERDLDALLKVLNQR